MNHFAAEDTLNGPLLGQAGGADALETPALVLDLPRFEANLQAMQRHCDAQGIGLRPHSKTHKCVEIGRRQMAQGAVGLCCAKLGEAEALVAAARSPGSGTEQPDPLGQLLVTSPIISARAVERLTALNAEAEALIQVVDHPDQAAALASAARRAGKDQAVLLDLDPGMHRTGMQPGEAALKCAQGLAETPGLRFLGLQMYAGNLMHIHSFEERRDRSLKVLEALDSLRCTLEASGVPVPILTGGGTGTYDIDPTVSVLTELQAGSYLFMDRQYQAIEAQGTGHRFLPALFVQTRVLSCHSSGLATTDAGLKAFATDDEPPPIVSGGPQGAQYFFFGDEQGGLRWDSSESTAPGAVLRALTPHCDPTVNLYDLLHVVDGDTLVDIWPIEGRGRSA